MSRLLSTLLLAGSLFLAGCWGSGVANDTKSRKDAFAEVLGFDAPPSAKEIESSWYFLRDSYIRWLRFSCDEPTISRIKGLKGAKTPERLFPGEAPGDSETGSNPNAPAWWRKASVSSQDLSVLEIDSGKTNESDVVHIWIDKKSRMVYATRNVWN